MERIGNLLTRHRNLFIVALLIATLCISSSSTIKRLSAGADVTALPVTAVYTQANEAVEVFVQQRDSAYATDLTALQTLCTQEDLDAETRRQAAEQLQEIIRCREAQDAIEKALANSSLVPCAAVVSGGAVTIVTQRTSFAQEDAALVMTLAAAHAGADPSDVRIITAE